MQRPRICILFLIFSLLVVSSVAVSAQNTYTITVDNGEIDVPERTVSTAGQEFTVTSIAPVTPGEDIAYQISTNADEAYRVLLYNDERGIEAFNSEGRSTFETDNLDPGTYVVAVDTGEIRAIQPVVITSYETTLSVPEEADTSGGILADISIAAHDAATNTTVETVQAVVANESVNDVITAEKTADGEYTADISSGYEPGKYRVYAVVRSNETVESGQLDVIGMSDEQTLTVTDADGDNTGASSRQEDTGSGGGADDDTADGDGVDDVNDSDTGAVESDGETGTDGGDDSVGSSTNDTSVSESDGMTGSNATDDSTPGFRILGSFVAVILFAAAARVRNR